MAKWLTVHYKIGGGGQFSTLTFDIIILLYVTYFDLKVKTDKMDNLNLYPAIIVVGAILVLQWLSVCPYNCPFVCLWKSGFCTITSFTFKLQWWHFTVALTMTRRGHLLILESKCQSSRSHFHCKLFSVSAPNYITFWHTIMILHTCVDHDSRMISIYLWSKVNGQSQICTLNVAWLRQDNSITFWHTIMILYTWVEHDLMKDSIDLGVNSLKVKVNVFIKGDHKRMLGVFN